MDLKGRDSVPYATCISTLFAIDRRRSLTPTVAASASPGHAFPRWCFVSRRMAVENPGSVAIRDSVTAPTSAERRKIALDFAAFDFCRGICRIKSLRNLAIAADTTALVSSSARELASEPGQRTPCRPLVAVIDR